MRCRGYLPERQKAPPLRAVLLPCAGAFVCAVLLAAGSYWAAWPVAGPLNAEFGWGMPALGAALLLSPAATTLVLLPAARLAPRLAPRTWATSGLLAGGATVLLAPPNLTHFWQLCAALVLAGAACGLALFGLWQTLRWGAPRCLAAALLLLGCLAGILPAALGIGSIVARNSWREGVAASGGILILASPLAYILLPGREVFSHGAMEAKLPPPSDGDGADLPGA